MDGHCCAARLAPSRAPAPDVLFGTEEQHGFSSEDDVGPPLFGGEGEVDDAFRGFHLAVLVQHSEDSQGVPDAGSEVRLRGGAHQERRRHGAERGGQEDLATFRRQEDDSSSVQSLESFADIKKRRVRDFGQVCGGGGAGGANEFTIDSHTQLDVESVAHRPILLWWENEGMSLGRALIVIGLVVAALGVMVSVGDKLPFRLGRLPGDIVIRGKNTAFYFPLVTCLLLSAVLSFILWLFGRR